MVTWTREDECDLLEALIDVSKGAVAKGLYEELSKKLNGRFSAEAIRQKFIQIRKKTNGGSLKSANDSSPGKSSPTISKRRFPGDKKKQSPKKEESPVSELSSSLGPTGEEIETPSKSRPARNVSKKSYKIKSDVETSEDDTRSSKPMMKVKKNETSTLVVKTEKADSGAEVSDEIKYEDDEM